MKTVYLIILFSLVINGLKSQDTEFSNDFIKRFNNAKENSKDINSPKSSFLWKTYFLVEAKKNWHLLTLDAKMLVNPGCFLKSDDDRPVMNNDSVYESAFFNIHYDVNGKYAVPSTDLNVNLIPDYVEWLSSIFDSVSKKYVKLGLNMPPADNFGGNDSYDVYIGGTIAGEDAIEVGTYGFVSPEDSLGNNAETTIGELTSFTSWMCLNYDYSWIGEGSQGEIDTAVAVTIAHEFMHAIQMGYNLDMDSWFMEGIAVWSEEYSFPGYDDNFQYLMDFFNNPDAALNLDNWNDELDGSPFYDRWYGTWIFFKYLHEKTDENIVKKMYEYYLGFDYASTILDSVLTKEYSITFYELFENFLVSAYLMTNNSDFEPFTLQRAPDYANFINDNGGLKIEGSIAFNGNKKTYNSDAQGNGRLMRMSADYIEILPSLNFNIKVTPAYDDSYMQAILISLSPDSMRLDYLNYNSAGYYFMDYQFVAAYTEFMLVLYRFDDYNDTISDPYSVQLSSINTHVKIDSTKSELSFYPNPVIENIYLNNLTEKNNIIINIYSYLGVKVMELSNTNIATVSNLPDGVYVLEVLIANERRLNKRFVKISSK